MSLIFGINLSDRLYIAADTRVSFFSNTNQASPTKYCDNVLKVVDLNNNTLVATAGSLKLAKYLINKLKTEKFIHSGINVLKRELQNWAPPQVDEYLNMNSYASVCLLFGGLDRSKNKIIDGSKLIPLVRQFKEQRNVSMGINDNLFKGISANPNKPNPFPELPVPDSHIFALLIDPRNNLFKIEEAKWGEYLAYGPKGFLKEQIPTSVFGRLEFEYGAGVMGGDPTILTALISSIAEKKNFTTIGGSVTPFVIDTTGIGVVTSKVHRLDPKTNEVKIISDTTLRNGNICYMDNSGEYKPLILITNYSEIETDMSLL